MTRTDFQAVRNVLRWAGIGAMVGTSRVDEALKAVSDLPRHDEQAACVRSALISLRMGVQLSQRDCKLAERSLEIVFDRQQEGDDNKEVPRG